MNRIFSSSFLLTSLGLLIGTMSCSKSEEGTPFEAVGDVYYVNKIIENKKTTALAFYAYGNKAINSAMVSLPNSGTVSLDESKENSFTVYHEPIDNDFSINYPAAGNYIFNLESKEGDKLQITDLLKIENLEIPEITEIRYENADFSYDVKWENISKADSYLLIMLDSERAIVFTSNSIEKGNVAYTLIQNDLGTWEKEVVLGESYTLKLFAFKYEPGADDSSTTTSKTFNVQEISVGEISFIWDEI